MPAMPDSVSRPLRFRPIHNGPPTGI